MRRILEVLPVSRHCQRTPKWARKKLQRTANKFADIETTLKQHCDKVRLVPEFSEEHLFQMHSGDQHTTVKSKAWSPDRIGKIERSRQIGQNPMSFSFIYSFMDIHLTSFDIHLIYLDIFRYSIFQELQGIFIAGRCGLVRSSGFLPSSSPNQMDCEWGSSASPQIQSPSLSQLAVQLHQLHDDWFMDNSCKNMVWCFCCVCPCPCLFESVFTLTPCLQLPYK